VTTILVTGGTGTTGSRVARRLREAGADVRVASRHPREAGAVAFDWTVERTFGAAVAGVDAIYLVAPTGVFDALGVMRAGLEAALASGVRRFVLLSASAVERDGIMMGKVHAFLAERALEAVVLRPSWFMQNFTAGPHAASARAEGVIYSATGDGVVPIIDAEDIAAVAAKALLGSTSGIAEVLLTGPQALSYDEIADMVGRHLGRQVRHQRLSQEALAARLAGAGLPDDYAAALAEMDCTIGAGGAARVADGVKVWTGGEPTPFETVLEREMLIDASAS
jgi:uncharacterized protein YbjT (DUF2867 family)